MPLRPVDEDLLGEICRGVALDHSGFLYVNKVKDQIRSRYEGSDTGVTKASSLTGTDMKSALDSIANDEYTEFERVRSGVYYYSPFRTGNDQRVADEVTNLFGSRLVVTSEELRSQFGIAIDDMDRFVAELTDKGLLRKIAAGERDYFTIGPRLKDQTGEAGVDARLRQKATHGKISHSQLERVITVEATSDVIRFLESQGFVADLDGEYLVESAVDEFGAHLADELVDQVDSEFERWNYVLPEDEFEQVVRNHVKARSDVLAQTGSLSRQILDEVTASVRDALDLEVDQSMVVERSEFDNYLEQRADQVRREVAESEDSLATESDFRSAGHDRIEDVQATTSEAANEYVRSELRDRYDDVVAAEFSLE